MSPTEYPEYNHCQLCPRMCGVNRNAGERGFCGETADCRIAAAVAHFGEEPCLIGTHGSGTIFFAGCSCGCFFCQNYQISHDYQGVTISFKDMINKIVELAEKGVHNINFVTPDHWWPHIHKICLEVRKRGIEIPFLWNSSGYCRAELLKEQAELIDIFLPDYKFAIPALAQQCMGDANYPEIAMDGLKVMVDRCGFLRPFDETGEMVANRGVMVRHLVLPGQVENSLMVLDHLYHEFGPQLPISVMSQFRPMPQCMKKNFLTGMVTEKEYAQVCEKIENLGFFRVFIQPHCGDENFVPDFKKDQPFSGNEEHQNK